MSIFSRIKEYMDKKEAEWALEDKKRQIKLKKQLEENKKLTVGNCVKILGTQSGAHGAIGGIFFILGTTQTMNRGTCSGIGRGILLSRLDRPSIKWCVSFDTEFEVIEKNKEDSLFNEGLI